MATHPYNNTQTHAGLFARQLEEEIEEYKQHSPRPGSGFHGVLRHPLDSSHTQHIFQETHANLKAGKETAETMLVNNVGPPLITNRSPTEGVVVEVEYLLSLRPRKNMAVANLYEPCKQHGILENFILTMAPGSNDCLVRFKSKNHLQQQNYYIIIINLIVRKLSR